MVYAWIHTASCSICLFLSVFAALVMLQLLNNYMIKSFIQSLMYHVRHTPECNSAPSHSASSKTS